MHATWYGCRPQPRGLCVRFAPIFGSRLLWPNGCMDQDATWYEGRPRIPARRRHCVQCGLSNPTERAHPSPPWSPWPRSTCSVLSFEGRCYLLIQIQTQFLAHVYCGQMAGWTKTPLGTEVDLGPGLIVLDGVLAPAKGAQQPPLLGPCLL